MWRAFLLTRACSSVRWKSRMWTISTVFRPPFPSTRKRRADNPRSTVGTVTEIYDYLRLLWARIGTPHCPKCGKEIRQQTIDQIVDQVTGAAGGHASSRSLPRSSAARRASTPRSLRTRARAVMSVCAWTAISTIFPKTIELDKNKKHNIEIIVDRLVMKRGYPPPSDGFRSKPRPRSRAAL